METAKCVKENLESEQRTVRMPVGGAVFEFEEIKQIYEDTQKQRGTGKDPAPSFSWCRFAPPIHRRP